MPPLEARLGLGYETASWSAGALWRLVHAQRRVAVGEGGIVGQDLGPSGGFGVFSLNAAWRIDQYVSFSAGVDNLFNKVYAEALNAAPVAIASYANSVRVNEPGRTFWGKLDVKW
jgi:iron complex outermembrane receptor protein